MQNLFLFDIRNEYYIHDMNTFGNCWQINKKLET